MAEIVYADDYEAITGQKIPTAAVETKVVAAPKTEKADAKAEVK
jgi:hypothetical protein